MLKRKLPILLFVIFCYLQYSLWFGKNNVSDYRRTQQTIHTLELENTKLKFRNDRLFAETSDLYDGLDAIEERARANLGMIKPNEHFYRIVIDSGNE